MHVALLGGSFNPPHVGHLLAAHYVWATQAVDAVWLVPSFHHPFGKVLAPFEDRRAMCELLCREASGWLGTSEIERELGGEGRTVETLRGLHTRAPGTRWTLVIGSDIVPDLAHWTDVEGIQALAQLLVLNRAGYPAAQAVGPALPRVSSSEIRAALAAGERPADLVPRTVLDYIAAHALYR